MTALAATTATSRDLEIAQLEIATARTRARLADTQTLLYRHAERLAAQEAELRFQKMLRTFLPKNEG